MDTLFSTGYLSDKIDTIEDYIKKENVLMIVAPTGSGKTTLLSGRVNGKKVSDGLVDAFPNSVIVTPFNTTNNLYSGLNIVGSKWTNKILIGKPNVMIPDTFNKYMDVLRKNPPKVIFIDESHEPFMARDYRDSMIEFMDNIRSLMGLGVKIVFISATPAAEALQFNAKILRFKRPDDRNIKFYIARVKDTLAWLKYDMEAERGNYDKICIFSNRDAQRVYETGIVNDYDITIYHSNWQDNVEQLRKDEMLKHDINVLTCIAFNGLNIRNSNEKILIDMRYTEGETTINEIIQIIGRFRNCKDIEVRLYVDGKFSAKSKEQLEQDFNDAMELQAIYNQTQTTEFYQEYYERLADGANQRAILDVDQYRKQFDICYLYELLYKESYDIKIKQEDKISAKKTNQDKDLKRMASDMWKEYLVNDAELDLSNREVAKYIYKWQGMINKLCFNHDQEMIWDAFKCMLIGLKGDVNKGNAEMWVNQFVTAIKIYDMTSKEWNEWKLTRKIILANTKISSKLKENVKKKIIEHDKLREMFKDLDFKNALSEVQRQVGLDKLKRYRDGNRKGGFNARGKHNKQLLYKGIQYDGVDEFIAANKDRNGKIKIGDKLYTLYKDRVTKMIKAGLIEVVTN